MSEPRDENQSAQEMPVLPVNRQVDGQVEDEDIKSLLENPVDEGKSQLNTVANFSDTCGLLVNPLEPGSAEPTIKDSDVPPELHSSAEVSVLVDETADASDKYGALEMENGEQSALANAHLHSGSELPERDVKADHLDNDQVELANALLDNGSELLEADVKAEHLDDNEVIQTPLKEEKTVEELSDNNQVLEAPLKEEKSVGELSAPAEGSHQSFTFDDFLDGDDSGTDEEQAAFMKELENFYIERSMDFKPPKFYGEGLNCLKLWRAVIRLGGYDRVTSCKLWRQVGESFKPPKTCTTVSWSFRIFYEKALLEYEKHKIRTGELRVPMPNLSEPMSVDNQVGGSQASSSGRARRDAAARAMQGWHAPRMLSNGEVGDPIIKDKSSISLLKRDKRDKHVKGIGSFKRKRPSHLEQAVKVARTKVTRPEVDTMVVDIGLPADWVKINVRRTKDCFEVYALVPGLLREEVQVQSDPAGRLIISGEPDQPDNPWGVTPFKKVITLPSRIDPHQTSAVVTLHGQLFVRAPFEQSQL